MMLRRILGLAILVSGSAAVAAPLEVSFSGVLRSVTDPNDAFPPSVVVGELFTASYSFDPDLAWDQMPSDSYAYYCLFESAMTASVGAFSLESEELGLVVRT